LTFKLQAATRDDDTRICDLRPVCGNWGLRIGAASLSRRLESKVSRHDSEEQYKGGPRHVQDSKGAIRISGFSDLPPFLYAFFICRVLK
jgi:hypothetical protein